MKNIEKEITYEYLSSEITNAIVIVMLFLLVFMTFFGCLFLLSRNWKNACYLLLPIHFLSIACFFGRIQLEGNWLLGSTGVVFFASLCLQRIFYLNTTQPGDNANSQTQK